MYNIYMSSSPEEYFNKWFDETHGTTGELELEEDVDECVEDCFDDLDLF